MDQIRLIINTTQSTAQPTNPNQSFLFQPLYHHGQDQQLPSDVQVDVKGHDSGFAQGLNEQYNEQKAR